jgi:hypothetical protein
MLGASAGGLCADGHQGLELAMVLPIVPPKAVSPPVLMRRLPLCGAAVDPAGRP